MSNQKTLQALEKSNIFSPCNGPDPIILEQLENIDGVVVEQQEIIHNNDNNSNSKNIHWMKNLELLCKMKMKNHNYIVDGDDDDDKNDKSPQSQPLLSVIDLRVLYIPTAMYALRPDSESTPGKQRGRNRADGRKRRTEIIRLLANQLKEQQQATYSPSAIHNSSDDQEGKDSNIERQRLRQVYNIRTVTLDFDDGSVKQPELVTVGDTTNSNDDVPSTENGIEFPKSGKEAIREWEPHLIYIQGGNTFWLHHCMEKGDWTQDLIDACCCNSNDATNTDQDSSPLSTSFLPSFSAVYCGVSAGAILAGQFMQTASWKELDNPSVVPGRETYKDWTDIQGLDITGGDSFFPHMEENWKEMVGHRTNQLYDSGNSTQTSSLHCIRNSDAYVVDGQQQCTTKLSSPIRNTE